MGFSDTGYRKFLLQISGTDGKLTHQTDQEKLISSIVYDAEKLAKFNSSREQNLKNSLNSISIANKSDGDVARKLSAIRKNKSDKIT